MDLYKDHESVIKVQPSDINGKNVNKKKFPGVGLIMFYSHGCPHCVDAVDQWVDLANILEEIKIGAFNCAMDSEHRSKSQELNISGVPTIKLVEDGHLKDYNRGRSKSDIINYLCDEVDSEFCKHKSKIDQTTTPRIEILEGGSKRRRSRKNLSGGSSCKLKTKKKSKSSRGGAKTKKCKGKCKNGKKCKNNVAKGKRKYCNVHGK